MARRFVTYNTEDQKAGRVNVDHNGVMKPGGGASLPSAAPYQQLVTDGEGKWVPADRLVYDGRMTIKWDGNTEGRVTIAIPAGAVFYKVSDYIPTDGEFKNAKYCIVGEDNPGIWEDVASGWEGMESEGLINEDFVVAGDIIIVKKPNISIAGIVDAKETGIYFINYDSLSFVSELQMGEVKQLSFDLVEKIVITKENGDYSCNVPYADFAETALRGVPIILIDKDDGEVAMDAWASVTSGDPQIKSSRLSWVLDYTTSGLMAGPQ